MARTGRKMPIETADLASGLSQAGGLPLAVIFFALVFTIIIVGR